jgi:hypothetical protein
VEVTETDDMLKVIFQIIAPVDPERVVAALIAMGWSVAGKREGIYIRLVGPGDEIGRGRSLLVPLNPENADHQELMDDVLMTLVDDVTRGRAAMRVLYSLRGPTVTEV